MLSCVPFFVVVLTAVCNKIVRFGHFHFLPAIGFGCPWGAGLHGGHCELRTMGARRYPAGSGIQQKTGSLPNRGAYSSSSTHIHNANASMLASGTSGISSSACNVSTSSRHNINKKRPISPEQVLRLFGTTTSSSSAPSNYNYAASNGIARDRGRRSPASSPPSTSHHVNRVSAQFRSRRMM